MTEDIKKLAHAVVKKNNKNDGVTLELAHEVIRQAQYIETLQQRHRELLLKETQAPEDKAETARVIELLRFRRDT